MEMEDEILQEFLAESWENLSRLDTELVALEKDPDNEDLLESIFRTLHTIKGTCGFIGLTRLSAVGHSSENVLGKMRDGVLEVSSDAISLVLQAVDSIKELLEGLEATGEEPNRDDSLLIAKLDLLADLADATSEPASSPVVEARLSDEKAEQPPTPPADAVATTESVNEPAPPQQQEDSPISVPVEEKTSVSDPISESGNTTAPEAEVKVSDKKSVADLSIRVSVDVLDSLMNLVGELVLTRNQLLQMARGDEESKYSAPITHLNRVTTDLQEGMVKARMQPIGHAWNKLPRLVRDLSQTTGRMIELEMSGAETELDRTVLDAIKDPLTHMVRNSADHGIEPPAVRRAAGKPEAGTIKLNAFHEGGLVIISIEDDGAGINTEKVLSKAVANGTISEAAAAKMSQKEILALVFKAGLSTAETVTSVSGRGVGMDVVKTQIERIGGTVNLTSVNGGGTKVRIKIPLTLAIISALVVQSGGVSFAIPQLDVVELVRLAAEDTHKIERVHNKEVFRLRNRLLPLVHLHESLDLEEQAAEEDRDLNIVVVQVGEQQFGLIVSQVFDTEEIVVKPMSMLLKDINIYQGTTILGDGRVIMILDGAGIASQSGGVSADRDQVTETDSAAASDTTSLLLFDVDGRTMAVPLSLVARLEEFSHDQLEFTGDKLVVQYRDDLLPLLPVDGQIDPSDLPEQQLVIVFSEGCNSMGLMVDEIKDISEERLVIRMNSQRPGVLGTAIVNGRATDIIETQYYIMLAKPDWFARNEEQSNRRVLVIDDSLFFRQLVTASLESEGYIVTAVESAAAAIDLIEHGERFDAIVADIEMPQMDGCEFAQWLRSRSDGRQLPLVALSSLNVSSNENRALASGFDRFLTKFNSQELLAAVGDLCLHIELETGITL